MKAMLTTIINRLVPYIPKGIPEGSASNELLNFFARLLQEHPEIRRVAETGFNTGVSSRAFLSARPDTVVVSFDIGQHVSVSPAKSAIDRRWPGRHQLIVGDSTQTLPAYARTHPDTPFDLIFIDGGHDYDVAKADLVNFQALAHEHTIVVMDDLTPWWVWGQGPTRAWQEALHVGLVAQRELFKNGQPATEITGSRLDSIWAVGHYRRRTD